MLLSGNILLVLASIFLLCGNFSFALLEGKSSLLERLSMLKRNTLMGGRKNYVDKHLDTTTSPCLCGIFLDGQLERLDSGVFSIRGLHKPTAGYKGNLQVAEGEEPILVGTAPGPELPCGAYANKVCASKCIETMLQHLPSAGPVICSSVGGACFKEKVHLFIRPCDSLQWKSSGLSVGKEFCCCQGQEVPCNSNRDNKAGASSLKTRSIPEIILDIADRAADLASDVLQNFNSY